MMAERSIKNAINNTSDSKPKSSDYFGFDIDDDYVDDKDNVLKENAFEKINIKAESMVDKLFNNIIKKEPVIKGKLKTNEPKPKYFLTFGGSGNTLFNILHNDFKTKIFKDDGKEYESNISYENKELIPKLIQKELKFGNRISSTLAEYLIRLEAHMLLENPEKPWTVVKNDEKLLKHFNHDKIKNRNAFVEIKSDHYENIKNFLEKYHILSENDFNIDEQNENDKNDNDNK
jgi:hypothetical protein